MECKIPIKEFDIRTARNDVKMPVMKGKKADLPSQLQIGEAWKVFGKWMVKIGESDQNEVIIPKKGLQSGHICIVLRGLGFTLYFYELIDEYTQAQYEAFDEIRLIFDRVLVTNQAASARLRYYLEKYEKWNGNVFPKFFNTFSVKKIEKWSDDIDSEITYHLNQKYEFKKRERSKYWKSITNPNPAKLKWDVKGCYARLLSAFSTLKPTLPQENIEIIEELITRCEHGYFLGYLIEKTLDEFDEKYGDAFSRSPAYLMKRMKDFRVNRERKVKLASQEAFGLTKEVKKKLERMFILEAI